jgi:16S rRNA pseudouridine516 synthase
MKKRLEKIISSQNNLSRKEIKKEIKIGNVLVDGQIQKDPAFKINPLINKIVFKNEEIEYQEFIYIVLNKPKNYVCATKDKDQSTIMDLINRYNNFDLHIVGRLDKDTTGIVLLTNDGQ